MSKSENNCLLGICSLDDFVTAVLVVSIFIAVLWICHRILNYNFPPDPVIKIFNKYISKAVVADGGKMQLKESDCKSLVLQTNAAKHTADPVRSFFKDTSRRRVKNDHNGNVPKKAENMKRQTSTSEESSCGRSESTDRKSSCYWSSTDCAKSHSKENLQHSSESIIPEVSEADEDTATSKVYRGETKTKTPVSMIIGRRKTRRKRRSSNKSAVKTINTWLEQGYHHFKICQLGGEVELPFCTARFPRHAVKELKTLRFLPKHENDLKVLVHPIHCSTLNQNGAISFNRSVNFKIKIEQDLHQILQDTEEAELQITECSVNINWTTQKKITIKKAEGYISFGITRFAGFRVIGRNLPLAEKSTLFYAICLKRPDGISNPSRHYFCILIHSAEDSMNTKAKNVLDSQNLEIVLPQQSILLSPPCRLTVSVTNENFKREPVTFEIENPCHNLHKTKHMIMERFEDPENSEKNLPSHEEVVRLDYTVSVSGYSNPKGAEGWFPFQWITSDRKQSWQAVGPGQRRMSSAPARLTDTSVTFNISASCIETLHVNAPNVD